MNCPATAGQFIPIITAVSSSSWGGLYCVLLGQNWPNNTQRVFVFFSTMATTATVTKTAVSTPGDPPPKVSTHRHCTFCLLGLASALWSHLSGSTGQNLASPSAARTYPLLRPPLTPSLFPLLSHHLTHQNRASDGSVTRRSNGNRCRRT